MKSALTIFGGYHDFSFRTDIHLWCIDCCNRRFPFEEEKKAERRNGEFIRRLIADREIAACHDISDGGLLVTLAEMALDGGIGVQTGPDLFEASRI